MNLLEIFETAEEIKNLDNCIISFTTAENAMEFPYPSIILYKGHSDKYGDGYAILVDFEKGLEIWSEEWLESENVLKISWEIMELTKVYYYPKKLDLPSEWEEFNEFIDIFMQNSDLVIIAERFEKMKNTNNEMLKIIENSLCNMDIIRDSIWEFFVSQELLYKIEIKSSGRSLLISVDLEKYIQLVSMVKDELEKRLLWLILRIVLENGVSKAFEEVRPSIVTNGIMKVDLESLSKDKLRNSLIELKKYLDFSTEDLFNAFNNLIGFKDLINDMLKIQEKISNENEYHYLEMFDMLIIDYINNEENSVINKMLEFSKIIKKDMR